MTSTMTYRLEELLFSVETTESSISSSSSRLPKTSKNIDIIIENNNNQESPAMTSTMTESESSTTETLMKVSTSFQALDYFEYVDSEKKDEDVKYLEKAIGVPEESGESGESEEFGKSEEFGESSSEGRGFQADEPATIEFDDLIARTQASAGKNARALQFDENS